MKHLIRFVARLYPTAWRNRYRIEFAALLEDVNPDWRTFLNVLSGALGMQMRTWNFGRILAVGGILGAFAGLAVWSVIPRQYASVALLKIVPSGTSPDQLPTSEDIADHVGSVAREVMTRSSLTQIIRTFNLYATERAKTPLEDIVDGMREKINIRPVGSRSGKMTEFSVQFVERDPVLAQRVVEELAARFIGSNMHDQRPGVGPVSVVMLDSASLAHHPISPNLSRLMTLGIAAGLAFSALLALLRRSPKRA